LAIDFPAPRVIGHRGAALCAPENTLAGFKAARALGAEWVEFDVQATRDDCPVLIHDARLDRTTNGNGLVADRTSAEIATLDAGSWFGKEFRGEPVPTFDSALALLDELGLGALIEVKARPGDGSRTMAAALRTLAARKLRVPCELSSFDEEAVALAGKERADIPRALIVKEVPADWLVRVERLRCAALHAGERGLTEAVVARVTAKYPLRAYTVNAPARAKALFQWGVAAVFTDCPDVIISGVGHRSDGPAETGPRGSSQK
jgi:glycerophosphoryl diester phosphodiesterase